FTQKDGLRDNRVTAICSAQNGVMWFGTCGGVTRYDGKQFPPLEKGGQGGFINFTDEDGFAHYFVSTVHSTPDGVMWFGTSGGGVTRYDGKQFPPLEKGGKGGFTTFTTRDGLVSNWIFAIHSSPDGVMWFGTLNGISRYDGKQFISFTTRDGLAENRTHAIYQETDGMMWFGTGNWRGDGGISRYDGKRFINFTTKDGLADSWGTAIYQDDDGVMWFGTRHGGVSRYDGRSFVTLTTEDGLAGNRVKVIHCAHDGAMWFGTLRNGVSRYDGKQFINFTTKDGLPHNEVWAIHSSPDGIIWFGTRGGISRYDGKTFVNFTEEDGLSENEINVIYRAPDGVMWFGTQGGGVSRYDGRAFVNFTMKDGLPDNRVHAIYRDTDGVMWFGTDLGVCRYDGKAFVTLTKEDGLAEDWVTAIYRDKDGVMWFGTAEGGVSRYDGKEFPPKDLPQAERRRASSGGKGGFVNFTKEDGLADHWVSAIYQDSSGVMCFATLGGGVSQYDGVAWTSLDTRDGLASNTVHSIYAVHEVTAERSEQDSDGFDTPSATQPKGFIWFGTEGGITRYRRSRVPPIIRIIAVTTDRRYTDLDELVPAVVGTRITFEYDSIDFKTHPEKRLYRYKLDGYEADWNPPTRETQVDYAELPIGEYTFHVQAIDRDLNYSEPATVQLTVQPDSRDFMVAALQTEVDRLRREVGRKYYFTNIVGSSAPMKQVYALMGKAIDSGLTVLISGETGTGKELVAKAIHYSSPRKDQPLCELNCGAVPKELVASILFGYREGAFTGATKDTTGLFESASGGTILLDEIGSMSEEAQLHLLRVLQEHKIQRIGETHLRDVDVRVIAITNQDLAAEVRSGRFREDLYYRLNVFPIHLPALRDRLDDIPLLAEHFLQKACQEYQKSIDSFGAGVIEMLQSYNWPGNVRELESEIYRAAAFVEEGLPIHTYHFSSQITRGESLIREVLSERVSYSASLERFRRRLVEEALRECGGNRSEAARMLGMQRPNLVALIKRLGIEENSGSKD
ncbi:MAG: sigma 54-interacting transcriptional regulator, partial [Candidatus Poribacteria bacterium]